MHACSPVPSFTYFYLFIYLFYLYVYASILYFSLDALIVVQIQAYSVE